MDLQVQMDQTEAMPLGIRAVVAVAVAVAKVAMAERFTFSTSRSLLWEQLQPMEEAEGMMVTEAVAPARAAQTM
jgi:hypothetical protein